MGLIAPFSGVPRIRTATVLAALALSAAVLPSARGQEASDAGGAEMLPAGDLESVTAADTGFAAGEPSPRTQPYQVVPETPPPPAGPTDWFGRWQNWKADLKKKTGTSFELYINPSEQVVVAGPNSGTNRGAIWFNFHLEQSLWQGARLVTNTRGGNGDGLNRYVDSTFNFNQHTGEDTPVYVSHLFLEQKLFNDHFTLAAGKMDLLDSFDSNEVGSWNLIPYSLARNPSIPAPYHSIGATARWDPCEFFYAEAGISDSGGHATETGLNTAFRDEEPYFSIYEIGIKPKLLGRPGTYRFIFWNNSGDIGRFDGNGIEDGDQGVALNFDQQITDRLSIFGRYGYSNPGVRRMHHYWSVGGTYAEPIPGRKDDTLGVGIAQAIISEDYREASGGDSTETQIDCYYKIRVQPWIDITPDVQVILNPDHDPDRDVAVIAGVYVEMRF